MRKLLLLPFLFLSFSFLSAQNFLGLANSNYAGVFGVDLQPASIADNRLRFDIGIGGGGSFYNDYLDIKSSLILGNAADWEILSNAVDGRSFFPERLNGNEKFFYAQQDFHLPSIMLSLGRKHSIAITNRIRTFVNVDNVSEILARQLYFEINEPSFWGTVYNNDGLQASIMNYMESGINYARVLVDNETHFLKGGVRLKRLIGGGAFYFRAETMDFEFDRDTLMSAYNVDAEYGHSPNIGLNVTDIFDILTVNDLLSERNRGWGWDIGFVYEYRPNHEKYNYGVGKYRKPRRDKNKYKFRIGASLLDLGGITFPRAETSRNFSGDMIDYSVNRLIPNGALDLDAIIANNFDVDEVFQNEFRMPLPTSASLQFDYRIGEHLALNVTPFWGFRRENVAQSVRIINNHSVSVRWEGKRWGLTVPVSFGSEKQTSMGLMARVGPLIVGSDNIISLSQREFSRGANVYAALRFGIPYGAPKDKDHDGVPNFYDQCPEVAGIESLDGCRERFEEVPLEIIAVNLNEPTPPEFAFYVAKADNLEIDKLKAKVASLTPPPPPEPVVVETQPEVVPVLTEASKEEEKTPEVLESKTGTPEVVVKPETTTPTATPTQPATTTPTPEPGRQAMQLAEVNMPWAPRLKSPSLEKERVPLRQLKTKSLRMPPKPAELEPYVPIYSRGEMLKIMPYADLDGDGVPNVDDDCPDIPGDVLNEGCPEVEEGFFKEDVFKSLYFDVGSNELRAKSKRVLLEVSDYLKENPEAGVVLAGHTDNSGTEISNVGLSDRRANAAQDYLISLGVKSSQIVAFYYGEGLPAASNKSAAGKQLNRRVDISFRARN
jgi:outer membrane protein OmpA-like peptidoglycan-associated protein